MGNLIKYGIAIVVVYIAANAFFDQLQPVEKYQGQSSYVKVSSNEEGYLEKIPNPYYISHPWPDHSAYGMELCVGKGFVTTYERGVFDCSNMASFLQWKLKKFGFDSKICVSNDFRGFDPNKGVGHAWVAVDIPRKDAPTLRFYVEPTAHNMEGFNFLIIRPFNGDYKYYNEYDHIYNDIYELAKREPVSEYNWWTQLNYTKMANTR
jgi:hypothetical protein